MSTEDKAAFDAKIAERTKKFNAADAEVKATAKYHEMTDAEKAMFDKMLIAQKTLKAEEFKKFDKEEKEEKIAKGFDNMTADQKAAMKEKMGMMKNQFTDEKMGQFKNDFKMKADSGYFNKMGQNEKALFDKKMQGFKQGRDEDDKEWKAKLTAMKQKVGWDTLSDQKKKSSIIAFFFWSESVSHPTFCFMAVSLAFHSLSSSSLPCLNPCIFLSKRAFSF
jgi:hypothetical protein